MCDAQADDAQADDAPADDAQAGDAARLMVCVVCRHCTGERDRRPEWAGSGEDSRCQTFCDFVFLYICNFVFLYLLTGS